jgi:hypothetical protein
MILAATVAAEGIVFKGSELTAIFVFLASCVIGIIGALMSRTLKSIDQNQTGLWDAINGDRKEVSTFKSDVYNRLRPLEAFKAQVEILHPMNHQGQNITG